MQPTEIGFYIQKGEKNANIKSRKTKRNHATNASKG